MLYSTKLNQCWFVHDHSRHSHNSSFVPGNAHENQSPKSVLKSSIKNYSFISNGPMGKPFAPANFRQTWSVQSFSENVLETNLNSAICSVLPVLNVKVECLVLGIPNRNANTLLPCVCELKGIGIYQTLQQRNPANQLTHKQLEVHGYILSTVTTDALVLKHQGIRTCSAD